MAEKKLLNLIFSTEDGSITYNIGANSTDGLKQNDTSHNSVKKPLNQVGGLLYCNAFYKRRDEDNKHYFYEYLHTALTKSGYGQRVVLPQDPMAEIIKYYLNGDINAPYLKFVTGSNPLYISAHLFTPDGTDMGLLINTPASVEDMLCGILYEDGTFTGDTVSVSPYSVEIDGKKVYLDSEYEWVFRHHYENAQVIYPSVLEYLQTFQPKIPEGEFISDGQGDFNSNSDPVNIPELPTASALATGMVKLYQMSNADLNSLNNYLWSDLFDIDTLKKMFNDPMQAILNLSFSPLSVELGVKSAITIGNIVSSVTGNICLSQYQKIDFGTIRLNEYWANFADYSPYTRLSIYLPYVGTQTISIDDVMNGSIQLVGFGDVLTGSVVYVLYSVQTNRAGHGHKSVLYSWGGNCQYQIPLTANNMSSVISSLLGVTSSVAGGIAATVATGGITAPIVASALSGTISNTLNAKQQTQRSGGVGGATGIFGVQTPYLILERPETRTIDRYSEFIGEPTESSGILGNFSGYVKVKSVHVGNIGNASDSEKSEIERILKEGVII